MWEHSKKATVCESERVFSPDTRSAGTLILDFQPPELWKINICCLSHPVYLFWNWHSTKYLDVLFALVFLQVARLGTLLFHNQCEREPISFQREETHLLCSVTNEESEELVLNTFHGGLRTRCPRIPGVLLSTHHSTQIHWRHVKFIKNRVT